MKKALTLALALVFVFSMTGVALAGVNVDGGTSNNARVTQSIAASQVNNITATSGPAVATGGTITNTVVVGDANLGLSIPIKSPTYTKIVVVNDASTKAKSGDVNVTNFSSNSIVQKANISQTAKSYSYKKLSNYKKKRPPLPPMAVR